ncbi:MAG: carbohydrate ABC transporter permease [Spirochaetaceae bacterium]|jgi:ABC-type glycerol-3-phosphate transport system permease component|nr:carbohydrate ABC transporter permease [Spirochaetaceae bacterium]
MKGNVKKDAPLKIGPLLSPVLMRLPLLLYFLIVAFPLVWMVYSSFKTSAEFRVNPVSFPQGLYYRNYQTAWENGNIGRYFLNTLFVDGITLGVLMFFTATTAYVLARFRFWGSRLMETIYMGSLLLPGIVALLPIFLQIRGLGLINTYPGLIIMLVFSSLPFSIFLMLVFFRTIPREFEEAAYIDGCSYFRAFAQIILPIAKIGLVTVLIFNFINVWSDYSLSLVLISDSAKRTIQLGLAFLVEVPKVRTDMGALFAGLTMVTLPLMAVYIIFQNKIVASLTAGGLKI